MRLSKVTILLMLLGFTMIVGCGDTDLLDETGQRYTASISIRDLDEDTLTVDAFRSSCDGEPEPYGPASAAVSFTVSDTAAAGITLTNYVLEYIPLPSEDGVTGIVMPPTLDGPLTGGNLGIDILPGETVDFEITCMSTDTKEEYRTKLGWILCPDDPSLACQADLASLEAAITSLQTAIDTTLANLAAATTQAEVDLYTALLATQNEQLAVLQGDYYTLYYSYVPPYPDLDEGRYRIRITFHFEDATGNDRSITREDTVWLGNYDNC